MWLQGKSTCSPEGEEKCESIRGFVTNSGREPLLNWHSLIFFFPLTPFWMFWMRGVLHIHILYFHSYGSLFLMWRFKSFLYVLVMNSTDQKINMHVYSFLFYSVGVLVWNMLVQSNYIFEITVKILSPALLVVLVINYLSK